MDEEKQVPPEQSLEERIKLYESELAALQKKYQLESEIMPTFPVYNVLPDEVKLALLVLVRHKIVYKLAYVDKAKGASTTP